MVSFWVFVLAVSMLLYVLLDGFDLGVGILFGLTRDEARRHTMMSAVAPIWDGNETWLVVSGVILWGAFPIVYARPELIHSILGPSLIVPGDCAVAPLDAAVIDHAVSPLQSSDVAIGEPKRSRTMRKVSRLSVRTTFLWLLLSLLVGFGALLAGRALTAQAPAAQTKATAAIPSASTGRRFALWNAPPPCGSASTPGRTTPTWPAA